MPLTMTPPPARTYTAAMIEGPQVVGRTGRDHYRMRHRLKRESVRLARQLERRVRRDRRPPLHFLHIGKTGGTAIREALHSAEPERHALVFHTHSTTLRHIPPGEQIVFFIREPLSRFVSGFASRQRKGQPRYFVEWGDAERAAFELFSSPGELARGLRDPSAERRREADLALRTINHVRFGYEDWLGPRADFNERLPDVFFIGRQEHLAADSRLLFSRLGVEAALPTNPASAHRAPGPTPVLSGEERTTMEARLAADIDYFSYLSGVAARLRSVSNGASDSP